MGHQAHRVQIGWNSTAIVLPGRVVLCTVIVHDGRLTLPYTGILNVAFESGRSLSYPIAGTMRTVMYSTASVIIDDRTDTLFGFGNATNATVDFIVHTLLYISSAPVEDPHDIVTKRDAIKERAS